MLRSMEMVGMTGMQLGIEERRETRKSSLKSKKVHTPFSLQTSRLGRRGFRRFGGLGTTLSTIAMKATTFQIHQT